ncbi:hypothetical protein [Cellulomonas shaoxiangyii]|uniref:Uncharacterized protein n=1 Tax=Cellulomonas shaoxiangyii TaxID=2566013 RepID=A0A4P7SNJ9_9CELL|nr:hypothetical protein [Cellulomonas shaoxiangyii]QCB94504.1 hypothetical protein E5225_14015 [Cellulomonas shaoxiangyii]TGY86086.1 hypothetical protein E5226_03740 [Cellulomonas shaoxiangyii]
MAEELILAAGHPDEFLSGALPALDEPLARTLLGGLGVDVSAVPEGVLDAGRGTVFWQIALEPDAQGALTQLAGEVYGDPPVDPEDVLALWATVQGLAAALGARMWVRIGGAAEPLTAELLAAVVGVGGSSSR